MDLLERVLILTSYMAFAVMGVLSIRIDPSLFRPAVVIGLLTIMMMVMVMEARQ